MKLKTRSIPISVDNNLTSFVDMEHAQKFKGKEKSEEEKEPLKFWDPTDKALLSTCSQIRHEASSLFHRHATFKISYDLSMLPHLP